MTRTATETMIRTATETATGQAGHHECWVFVRAGVRPMLPAALDRKVWAHLPIRLRYRKL